MQIHAFIEVADFRKIFETPISRLLNLKNQKNPFAKKLINATYGRLGMTKLNTQTQIYFNKTEEELIKNNVCNYVKYNNIYLVEEGCKTNKRLGTNLAAAAIITARARIKLFSLIQQAKNLGAELVYTDTDSCFIKTKSQKTHEDVSKLVG